MDTLWKDLRYSIRCLLKQPVFTLIALFTLALGIGANTAIFSVVNALLLNPLTFPELDRIVTLWDKVPSRGVLHNEVAMANYLDWKAQSQSFDQLGLYRWWSPNLSDEPPERVQGYLVTANFLDVLGVKPWMGRAFTEEENQPGKDAVAILTYGLWQRRFGSDPNIVNKAITLNGIKRTIIGVMPRGYVYPKGADVLAPLPISPELARSRGSHAYYVVGRLKPKVTIQAAQADLDAITSRLEKQYPSTNTGWGVTVFPIVADTVRMYSTAVWVLMGAVGVVLLIACANVANLMLARASGRHKEIALRAALGASRSRIIRQLLTESVILALIGGALGVLIAYWGVELIRVTNPGEAARYVAGWDQMGINPSVLGFTVVLSLVSGLLFGLAPAWQVSKPDLNNALKESGRRTTGGSHRVRSSLMVTEVALSLMLLVCAGLLVRSFLSLLKTNPGFNSENLMTMSLNLPAAKYKEAPQRIAFFADLVQRVKALPGVESAAVVNYLPLGGANSSDSFLIEGVPEPQPGQEFDGRYRVCSPDYFQTMGIAVRAGRVFTEQDKADGQPVIIVNETLAHRFWPNESAVGKRMRFYGPIDKAPWMQVVGVVQDVKHELNLAVTPDYYLPHAQDPWQAMTLVAKTRVEPSSMAGPMRQAVWSIDKGQPVSDVRTMKEWRAISLALYSFSSVSLGIFAGVALLLAAVGIYGVMAYAVSQRTHEIGIRMALGARASDVLRLVVKNGMSLALLGVIVGLAGAWGLTRFLGSLLVGVSATDALTLSAVSALLLVVALIACYAPARRATKVDPMVALRNE